MTWFEKRTRRNTDQEREALAASVEDVVAEELAAGEWSEEYDALLSIEQRSASNTAIISPRLRLQSRPVPTVHISPNRPVSPVHVPDVTTTNPVEVPFVSQQGQRLAGRSTKVRLQAVRPGQEQEASTERLAVAEKGLPVTQNAIAAVEPTGKLPLPVPVVQPGYLPENLRLPGGSGLLRQGQSQLTVTNVATTERSVVMVMLAGNPGPVVVQYILLHPGMGFTFHLSAPTAAPTPFNYVIWPF